MGMLRKLPLLCNWAFKNLRDKIDELLETFQKIIKFGSGGGPLHIPCRNNRVERSSRRKPVWVVISNADKFGFLAEQGWLVGNWERSSSNFPC